MTWIIIFWLLPIVVSLTFFYLHIRVNKTVKEELAKWTKGEAVQFTVMTLCPIINWVFMFASIGIWWESSPWINSKMFEKEDD